MYQSVVPGTRPEAGGDVGECEDQQSHAELDQDRHEEETREVDEADDVDGKLGDDQEDPGHQLEEGAGGQKSPANNMIVMTNDGDHSDIVGFKPEFLFRAGVVTPEPEQNCIKIHF